jgi:hypothetical protein
MGRPLGVTIVGIVLAISGIVNVLAGLVGMNILKMDLGVLGAGAEAAGAGTVVSGVLTLIVAFGMFSTAGWAWLLTVVVMIVRIAVDLWAIVTHGWSTPLGYAALVNLVISAIILWYFQRSNVRAAFGR